MIIKSNIYFIETSDSWNITYIINPNGLKSARNYKICPKTKLVNSADHACQKFNDFGRTSNSISIHKNKRNGNISSFAHSTISETSEK